MPRLKTHLSADEHMQLYIAKCSFKKPKSGVESINWQPLRLKVAINICKSELHVSIYVEPPEFSLCLQEHSESRKSEQAEVLIASTGQIASFEMNPLGLAHELFVEPEFKH